MDAEGRMGGAGLVLGWGCFWLEACVGKVAGGGASGCLCWLGSWGGVEGWFVVVGRETVRGDEVALACWSDGIGWLRGLPVAWCLLKASAAGRDFCADVLLDTFFASWDIRQGNLRPGVDFGSCV